MTTICQIVWLLVGGVVAFDIDDDDNVVVGSEVVIVVVL